MRRGFALLASAVFVAYCSLAATDESQGVCLNDDGDCNNSVAATPFDCGASEYLSPTHTVPGFHVLCLRQQVDGSVVDATVFKDGANATEAFQLPSWDWQMLRKELEERLALEELGMHPRVKYPWAMFTADGNAEIDTEEAAKAALEAGAPLFIFKGGAFIWPGVQIGHKQVVTGLQGLGSIEMTTASMRPLVFEMRQFLSKEECDHIQARSVPHMAPSPVSLMDHDRGKPDTEWRTSTTYFLSSRGDPLLQAIDQRVWDLTKQPIEHQEDVQVLRYEISQRYDAHTDYFDPSLYQTSESVLTMTDHGRRNRMITVFWYLSDVAEGGETNFPRFDGYKGHVNFKSCDRGLKVKPEEGKVAMFYSLLPDGQFDDTSLHGACPVINGTKWAANKWVWNREFRN